MSLNLTPNAQRTNIGFFGSRNAGKSSLVNAFASQQISVVSEIKGTTTDPVKKAMELLPIGPVTIIDTPGFDDEGVLGEKRVEQTKKVLTTVDLAILVCDARYGINQYDRELLGVFEEKNVPYLIAFTKSDLVKKREKHSENIIYVSSKTGENIEELKKKTATLIPQNKNQKSITEDIIKTGETAILVTPIDESAPKGRIILPQQQVIRSILDSDGVAVVVKETQLEKTIATLKEKVSVVITDSQAFKKVSEITPRNIPLTSFSILMANYKGVLDCAVEGVTALENLKNGDKILISEGCTHHRQCGDIGSVKLPAWIKKHTGKELEFEFTSGNDFPEKLSKYALVIHCGGCMITQREVINRMEMAKKQNVPFTNYGITIAYVNKILKRSIEVFPHLYKMIKE